MKKLSNITLEEFRAFMAAQGLVMLRTNGGHEMWAREGMPRPVVFQTHIDPIPEFVVRNNLMAIGVSRKDFLDYFEK